MNKILLISSVIWVSLHYVIPHIYTRMCVPLTPFGFLESIIISTAPHCEAMRYTLYVSGNNIKYMWITAGAWCISVATEKLLAKVPK